MKSTENILRSLFISFFPFLALLTTIYAVLQYIENVFLWQTTGMFIVAFAIVTFFAGIFIKPRARTDTYLKPYSVFVLIGAGISLLTAVFLRPISIIALTMSLFLAIGWLLYLKWYSVFENRKNEQLKVAMQLDEFELEDPDKKPVSSTTFLGKPSIFLFYRGNWCPLCMAQIKEVAGLYDELEELGVNTVMVSPQPHKQTKILAEKYNLNFHFLVDYKNKVAKQLGVFAPNGIPAGFQVFGYDSDTVLPTVVITDKNGTIIYSDLTDNYRIRPEPSSFLKIIRASITG